jgi:DEAD/DEAH box helicase domain-containing protein
VFLDHIKCAAFELPFTVDEKFGPDDSEADLQSILRLLSNEGFVHQTDNQFH